MFANKINIDLAKVRKILEDYRDIYSSIGATETATIN